MCLQRVMDEFLRLYQKTDLLGLREGLDGVLEMTS